MNNSQTNNMSVHPSGFGSLAQIPLLNRLVSGYSNREKTKTKWQNSSEVEFLIRTPESSQHDDELFDVITAMEFTCMDSNKKQIPDWAKDSTFESSRVRLCYHGEYNQKWTLGCAVSDKLEFPIPLCAIWKGHLSVKVRVPSEVNYITLKLKGGVYENPAAKFVAQGVSYYIEYPTSGTHQSQEIKTALQLTYQGNDLLRIREGKMDRISNVV